MLVSLIRYFCGGLAHGGGASRIVRPFAHKGWHRLADLFGQAPRRHDACAAGGLRPPPDALGVAPAHRRLGEACVAFTKPCGQSMRAILKGKVPEALART